MTKFRRWWFAASLLAAFVAGGAHPARAQSQTQAETPAAHKYFTDTELINQDNPLTDTPARLKTFSQRFSADAGWSFITGQKENVELALKKLGMFVSDKDDHVMILIIGNERSGLWKKALAVGRRDEIAKIITETANDK